MRTLAALFALLALSACDSGGADDAVGDLVLAADGEGFLLQTVEEYPCFNFTLAVDAEVTPDRAEIEIVGVEEPEVCQRAFGPARARVPFAPDAQTVSVEVVLRKSGRTDTHEYGCGFAGCLFTPSGTPSFSTTRP